MKKKLALLLAACLALAVVGCGSSAASGSAAPPAFSETADSQTQPTTTAEPEPTPETTPEAEASSRILVAYFSCTGHTQSVAEQIAQQTGADLYEITPADPYTAEDLNYNDNNCRANQEMNNPAARPALGGDALDLSDYDTILLGYPIWWGTMPRILNTFLDTYDLSGKTVLPFCTSGSSGISQSLATLKEAAPGADVRDGLRASGPADSGISAWLSQNGLTES